MFIRSSTQNYTRGGKSYRTTTYRLVEGYRTANGKVRQETLSNLGTKFDIEKDNWKPLADRIEELLSSQTSLFELEPSLEEEAQRIAGLISHKYSQVQSQRSLASASASSQPHYKSVDLNSLNHHSIRKIGAESIAYNAAKQIKLDSILSSLGLNPKQIELALGSIIGRCVHPGSELNTHTYLTTQSGLDELMQTNFSNLSLKNFYKIADKLLTHKSRIEELLYENEKSLFDLKEVVTLYDITNTYLEGRALHNAKAQYGRAKDKRNDCPLVSLGLVLDGSGFPKRSHIFAGNVSEPKTLEEILTDLDVQDNATIVMDAGFATEENIQLLKDRGFEYIVVSRKRSLNIPDQANSILVKDTPGNQVKVTLIENPKTQELELYCHSKAKEQQNLKFNSKFESRFECELEKLANGLSKKGTTKRIDKVNEKIGRLKERYRRVAKVYDIQVDADDKGNNANAITWHKKQSDEQSIGVYCLRTNRKDLDEKTFWDTYVMITEVEATFRSLKSELGLRPIYHRKECRVDAHLFITVLAYHIVQTIRFQLKQQNIHASWDTIRQILDTQMRISSSLMTEDGKKITIRKNTMPDQQQLKIYKALGCHSHLGKNELTMF